jgi:hypothetical protein
MDSVRRRYSGGDMDRETQLKEEIGKEITK